MTYLMIIIVNLNIKYNQYILFFKKIYYVYTIFNKVDHLNFFCYLHLLLLMERNLNEIQHTLRSIKYY